MKKLVLPLSFCVLATTGAFAQAITLNQTSFATASTSGADTLLNTATIPTYPALTADAGANLDFTGATSNTSPSVLYRVAATAGSQWADSMHLTFSVFPYTAKLESSLSALGYVQSGEHIDKVGYSLAAVTFIPTDSLVINSQDIPFSANKTKIAFPATNQSTWSSTYHYDFSFVVTATPFGLNHAAGVVRAYIVEKDTVIGYGKARVKDINGNGSAYVDVLQIETITSTTDSFFLNGSVAPANIVAGLTNNTATQGQVTVTKEQYYYRTGELTPLVHITYDPTNTTPATAQTQAARLPSSYIPETQYTRTLNVYPNPVTNHTIIVSGAPANYGNWSYELENITGQVVTKGALELNNNQEKTQVNLSGTIAPGTYFLHMYNGGAAQETVRTLTIK